MLQSCAHSSFSVTHALPVCSRTHRQPPMNNIYCHGFQYLPLLCAHSKLKLAAGAFWYTYWHDTQVGPAMKEQALHGMIWHSFSKLTRAESALRHLSCSDWIGQQGYEPTDKCLISGCSGRAGCSTTLIPPMLLAHPCARGWRCVVGMANRKNLSWKWIILSHCPITQVETPGGGA